jgi:tetratricopeptide (TPR) repeat protein
MGIKRYLNSSNSGRRYARKRLKLGLRYYQLRTGDRGANLPASIACYNEALRFLPRDRAARLRHNPEQPGRRLPGAPYWRPGGEPGPGGRLLHRGAAVLYRRRHSARLRRDPEQPRQRLRRASHWDRASNLAQAIECYTEALRFWTAEAAQLDYAGTRNNLGTADGDLPTGDRAANLARTIECYTQALRFFTAEAAPARCRLTARLLGDAHFGQDCWAEARASYSLAIHAGELLYQATGSDVGRQARPGMRSRRRVLSGPARPALRGGATLGGRVSQGPGRGTRPGPGRPAGARQADRAAFTAAADRIKALEAEGRHSWDTAAPAAPRGRSFAERSAELVRVRKELAGVIERIQAYLPGFMAEGLDYPEIAAAASPERPLVYLLTTSQGGLALLVPVGSQAPATEHAVWLDGFTTDQLDELPEQHLSGEVPGVYPAGGHRPVADRQ